MAPDFALFFPGVVSYQLTHSVLGVVVACPLIGVAWFVLFRTLMHQPLAALLPIWIQSRLELSEPRVRWSETPLVAFAVGIGAATHVVWDSFTHADRWGTRLVPTLNKTAFEVGSYNVPWFKVLQYGSTFVLLPMMIALAGRELASREPRQPEFSFEFQTKMLASMTILLGPVGICLWHAATAASNYELLGHTVKSSIALLLVLPVVFSISVVAIWGRADGRLVPRTSKRCERA